MTDPILDMIIRDLGTAAPFNAYPIDPPRDLAQAYETQQALAARLLESGLRDRVAGWKIAANNPVLLARFGLEEPISAPVFGTQTCDSPAARCAASYREFAFEPEIAAILKIDVSGDMTEAEVADAIDRFVPAFELLDMRGVDMATMRIADAVAQNISNAGAVLGGPGCAPEALDLAALRTQVSVNGETRLDVTGAAPQNPVQAVAWLARRLSGRGETLHAGQFVLCGTHCPIWRVDAPAALRVEMSGLGVAALHLSN